LILQKGGTGGSGEIVEEVGGEASEEVIPKA
jgi:hypothetical protein